MRVGFCVYRGGREMNIEICINTNNYSGKDVQIDLKDIMDFTRNMYVKGNCEAVVKFECMPAAVYPDLIQVVLKIWTMDFKL